MEVKGTHFWDAGDPRGDPQKPKIPKYQDPQNPKNLKSQDLRTSKSKHRKLHNPKTYKSKIHKDLKTPNKSKSKKRKIPKP